MNKETESQLIEQAIAAREWAYAPYSKFKVGAALLLKDGATIVTGCNVENASYGLAICAERNAICAAVARGHREFSAIVVAASPLASPCGACRQFLVEFGKDIDVVSVDPLEPTRVLRWTSGELMPDSFEFEGEAPSDHSLPPDRRDHSLPPDRRDHSLPPDRRDHSRSSDRRDHFANCGSSARLVLSFGSDSMS